MVSIDEVLRPSMEHPRRWHSKPLQHVTVWWWWELATLLVSEREEEDTWEDDLAVLALEGVQRDESTILAPRKRGTCNIHASLFEPIFAWHNPCTPKVRYVLTYVPLLEMFKFFVAILIVVVFITPTIIKSMLTPVPTVFPILSQHHHLES